MQVVQLFRASVVEHFLDLILNSLAGLQSSMLFVAMIILGLWLLQLMNQFTGYRLNVLGIYPRHGWGLFGIVFSPFLHQDFRHLFLNSIPLFILLSFIFLYGEQIALQVTLIILILSGLGIWLFGRRGIHIGASGLVMGYFGFILAVAVKTESPLAIIIAVICLFYLSSLFAGLFPSRDRSSWEGHVTGFLAGIFSVYLI